MRNDLLADIVVAAGGVVTNKGNRNDLLQDWLDAVQSITAVWYNKTTGLVDCSYGLIECNEELITCL